MIRARTIAALLLGSITLIAWHFSAYTGSVLGIQADDLSTYPRVRVHPIFPVLLWGGISLVILGSISLRSDFKKKQNTRNHD